MVFINILMSSSTH